jgi:uncharacterized RDD family membrane protein YckC
MPYHARQDAPQQTAEQQHLEHDEQRRRRAVERPVGAAVWRRAVAAVIDTAVVFAPSIGLYVLLDNLLYRSSCDKVTGFYGEPQYIDCSSAARLAAIALPLAVFVGLAFIVEVGPTAGGRQSLGRRLSGARAVDSVTVVALGIRRAAGRFAFRSFVSVILGVGFLWMIWDHEDRTLHDLVFRSTVIDGPAHRWRWRRRRRRGFQF